MKFRKYHGTGNDFLILDSVPSPEKIKQVCDRHFGIGADGILVASPSTKATIMMNYYNADGSVAKMCGNGLRCFVRYLHDEQIVDKNSFIVETLAGLVPVSVIGDDITIDLGEITFGFHTANITPMALAIEGVTVYPSTLTTSHAVVFESVNEEELGPKITSAPVFTDGVNTSFVHIQGPNELFVRTHERGSGWTLSCGTGVAASAATAVQLGKVKSPVQVHVPGGALTVRVGSTIILQGPALKVAEGDVA
jgi:diaminopimelate epimerase